MASGNCSLKPLTFSAAKPKMGTGANIQLWVGKDCLTITDDLVYIDAAREMGDWQVREFQRNPIYVGEHKFFLRGKVPAQRPFAMRYILERWPEDTHCDSALRSFTYDEEFVRERDAEHAARGRYGVLGKALIPLYPLLGFLWSGAKTRLIPAGFVPRSITMASVVFCTCLMLLQGAFLCMRLGFFTLAFGDIGIFDFALLMADYALIGLMLIDCVLRFDQHIKDVEDPWGFCEWLIAPFRRKPVDAGKQT
jgi:hypothetical protein